MDAADSGYRVLARKYRPQTFADLIGQDALVRTLSNAIETGRLAHAFLLTGVRGVGKTSTARLIARALNCIGPDGSGGPSITPCGQCEPCRAIAESRHMDVIEIDAASRTGVDDMREIIDAVRYAAASARYKIYIIDEVHMLSKQAFNALLKTLEEPPPHVKFIFATTEIRKVPVTVLSRCQRFDLRRIPVETLIRHFARIAAAEDVGVEDEAIALIARAAEGSVRDGLSMLDQAIAHSGANRVSAETVRAMLGLADRGRLLALFEQLVAGATSEALANLRDQYDLGVDPGTVIGDLAALVHAITRTRLNKGVADPGLPEAERAALAGWSGRLGLPALSRLWQMLLKGASEVAQTALALEAAEMVLVRIIHASQLPDPGDLVRRLGAAEATASQLSPLPRGEAGRGAGPSGAMGQPSAIIGPDAGQAQPGAACAEGTAGASPVAVGSNPDWGPDQPASPDDRPFADEGAPDSDPADLPRDTDLASPAPSGDTDAPPPLPGSFLDLVELLEGRGHLRLGQELRDHVRLASFAPGRLEMQPLPEAAPDFSGRLGEALRRISGQRWLISLVNTATATTLREDAEAARAAARAAALADPAVQAAMAIFPGAELLDIVDRTGDSGRAAPAGGNAAHGPGKSRERA